MAITKTKQAKEFKAGASPIKLVGDYRIKKVEEEEFPDTRDNPLNPFDKDLEDDKKIAGYLDPMSEKNDMAMELFGKQLKDLTEDELDLLDEEIQRLRSKFMATGGRAQYGLGSLVKSIKKAAKKVVKSPIGKAALLYTVTGGLGNLAGGRTFFQNFMSPTSFIGGASDIFKKGALTNILNLSGAESGSGAVLDALKIGGTGGIITGLLSQQEPLPGESTTDFENRKALVQEQLNVQFKRLYPKGDNESDEEYEIRINALVRDASDQTIPAGDMAEGGRIGYASGSEDKFMELVSELREQGFSQQEAIEEARRILSEDKAMGGRIMRAMGDSASDNAMQASSMEGLPLRENKAGITELDLRKSGGFIPPVGVKEKADDIPAMLSNNEFVFTADAVRAAGGGSVNKGAQRMYDLMKSLESRVV